MRKWLGDDKMLTEYAGFGKFLVFICKDNEGPCRLKKANGKQLNKMTAREHYKCLFKYCFVHWIRDVDEKRDKGAPETRIKSPSVLAAMKSLWSAREVPDFDRKIETIRRGGKRAGGEFETCWKRRRCS